jgi:tight adherence protein C
VPPIVFGVMIGAAVLAAWYALTVKPSAARANLFADLRVETRPAESGIRNLGARLRRFVPTGLAKNMEADLSQAGHPYGVDVPKLLGIQAVGMVTLFLIPLVFGLPLLSLFGVAVGFLAPRFWISNEKTKRREAIGAAVSDTIDQLTICVEAGLGFDAAMNRVATTSQGPLAAELQHTVSDMRAGMPRDLALRALAARTQIPEIKTLVQALIQAQRNGTPLSDTLRAQAAEVRDKRKQAVEEKAGQLSTKLIFPAVLLFFPVLFLVLLAPSVAEFMQNFPG